MLWDNCPKKSRSLVDVNKASTRVKVLCKSVKFLHPYARGLVCDGTAEPFSTWQKVWSDISTPPILKGKGRSRV
jgi:hypothetical protein